MMRHPPLRRMVVSAWVAAWVSGVAIAHAHNGPPFPILSSQVAGAYKISIWTDPDTTDDGSAAGQFWVLLEAADVRAPVPSGTRVRVAIRPLGRPGPTHAGDAVPVNGAVDRQFIALLMDHEGPFAVSVTVDGALGRTEVESKVDATYDARPPAGTVVLYFLPFLALGALWAKVLLRRRQTTASRPSIEG